MEELSRVVVKPFDKQSFEVVKKFCFETQIKLGKEIVNVKIVVPKGFKTNGADIPRLFWMFWPPYKSEYFTAVIVHDFMCNTASEYLTQRQYDSAGIMYKKADVVFRVLLKKLNVSRLTVSLFYTGCNCFHVTKVWLVKIFKLGGKK